jgi:hypothetical protein
MTKFSLVLLCLTCQTAFAQSSSGYVVAAVGSREGKLASHAALGGELLIRKAIGLGAELRAVAGHSSFLANSANGYYHLPVSGTTKIDPFVTVGYTAAVGLLGFEGNAVNFGGGFLSWFHRRLGVRLEFRGFIQAATTGSIQVGNGPDRFYSVRAGIAFR